MNLKSKEEIQFKSWLDEAEAAGLIFGVEYEPKSFELIPRASRKEPKELKTKVKIIDKFLFHSHSYTPDFSFYINHGPLYQVFTQSAYNPKIWVDVKGGWMDRGSGQEFSINQKLMWDRHKIIINKIVPKKLFGKTWCPDLCRYSPIKKKPVKAFFGMIDINEYLLGE